MHYHEPADSSPRDTLVDPHTYSHTIRCEHWTHFLFCPIFLTFQLAPSRLTVPPSALTQPPPNLTWVQVSIPKLTLPMFRAVHPHGCQTGSSNSVCAAATNKGYVTKNWNSTLMTEDQNNSQGISILRSQAEMATSVFLFLLNPIRYEICVFPLY